MHLGIRPIAFYVGLLLLLLPSVASHAEETFAERYNLSQLNMSDGLPHNFVDDIIKDSNGFMWIATNGGGLSRYDGYEFSNYDVSTAVRLSSNFLHAVAEDRFGRLWIASDGGIDILDTRTDRVVSSDLWPADRIQLLHGVSQYLDVDDAGNVWFVIGKKVYCVEFSSSGKVTAISEYVHPKPITAFERVDDCVWMASDMLVYRLRNNDSRISLEPVALPQVPQLKVQPYMVTSLYSKENVLWVGTDLGLVRISQSSGIYKYYNSNSLNPRSISQNRITDIVETSGHDIIVSTLKGINIYNPITDDFERITQDTQLGQRPLSCNFINCICVDGDMLWLGTEICGVDLLIPGELSIKNYIHSSSPSSLSQNPVNAIIEDRNGVLWVGNVESGLNRRIGNSDMFEHFTMENHGLVHNTVSALSIDSDNLLWVGTWGNGVCALDLNRPNAPVVKRFTQLHTGFIGAVVADDINKGVWVSTSEGVNFIKDNTVLSPIHDERVNDMSGAIGGAIDSEDKLWMGTTSALIIIDLHSMRGDSVSYQILDSRLDEPSSNIKPRVSYIYKASDGTMYVGTNGYGLCYRKVGESQYKIFTVADGLANNSVRGIAEDKSGNIWVSTNCGMSVIDFKSGKAVSYTKSNGLIDDGFYWNASFCSPSNGNVYFGSPSGLTEIRRRNVGDVHNVLSKPVLTRLMVLNADVAAGSDYVDLSIPYADEVFLHERDRSFSVEFSALNYSNPHALTYQYRLRGFDSKWVTTTSDRRLASYTSLSPGDYEFEVRCADASGSWSEASKLTIHVAPFFYKTIWFYLLIMGVIAIILWQIMRYRMRDLKEQQRLLHILVKERTDELEQQKRVLEDKTNDLERQNEILSEQNVKITQQKESIQEMSTKIQKLSVDKLQFFTNISHEIRTPITLIIGPIQRALKMTTNPQVVEQLQLVDKNSRDLLTLVNQLMDFRKIETGNMELKPTSGRLVPFINDIVHPFSVYASERNISIECYFRIRTETMLFDSDAMNKVVTNLLSNAVKYTADSSRIQVFFATIIKDGKEMLYASVRDEGNGVPEDELETIFNRYYQSDNHKKALTYGQSGTGIGLYLCKRLVDAVEGKIWARNNQNKGCSMRVLVPFSEGTAIIDEQKAEQMVEEVELEEQQAAEQHKMNILVVEDNRDMRVYIRTILQDQYGVFEAKDGVEGLTVLAENDIDFIICDLMMPVMDGIEFSTRVKNNFSLSHIPILVLTAQMSDEYRTKSYKIGVESYLHKPFDEQMLLARISGILEGKKSNQQKFQYSLNTDDLNIDKESEDEKFVKKVLELVEKNYMDSAYSIDDILKSMSCSKSMLNKKMQNVIGQSPGVFIRSYRLNVAKQLIILNRGTKNMNISQIAYEVGFNDPKYFTRCFTKHFCVTPSVLLDGTKTEADIREVPLDEE